jgi:hypothetical protein
MKYVLFFLLFAGPLRAETVLDFTDYHSVEVRNDIVARISVGDFGAVVDGGDPAQFIPAQFGEWIRFDRNTRWLIWTNGRRDRFDANISMPEVRELKALSGAKITADLGVQERFRAEAENGVITVSVDTPALRLRGNDGAVITVTGSCGRLTMLARPTSVMDLSGLECESIVIFGDKTRVALPDGANVVDQHADPDS